MVSKNNVLYYTAGTLAALTLLASGVFAAAPYIGFLAPVAALNIGLPFIIGYAVFSVVAIALSYKAISKNKTISEKVEEISKKDAQLASQAKEIEGKDKIISERDAQLAEKSTDISNLRNQLDEEKAKVQTQKQTISEKDALLIERGTKIEEDALKVAIADGTVQLAKGTVNGAVLFAKGAVNGVLYSGKYAYDNYVPSTESAKEKLSNAFDAVGNGLRNTYSVMPSVKFAKDIQTASQKAFASVNEAYSSGRVPGIVKRGLTDVYYPPIESAKGKISSVGDKLKNVYDTMPSAESARNWVPSLKTAGWIAGGTELLAGATYIVANGGLGVAGNSSNAVGNSTNSTKSGALIPNSSSVYYRPTDQQIKQIHDLISGSNGSAHNRSEPQWYKDLRKSETMEEIIDGGVLDNLFFPRVDNSINTSKQQGTLIDSVNLTKLTREVHPSAYSNSLPGVFKYQPSKKPA